MEVCTDRVAGCERLQSGDSFSALFLSGLLLCTLGFTSIHQRCNQQLYFLFLVHYSRNRGLGLYTIWVVVLSQTRDTALAGILLFLVL